MRACICLGSGWFLERNLLYYKYKIKSYEELDRFFG